MYNTIVFIRINTTMAATANYNIDQGATFSSTVTVKDNSGDPLNLTDYTATAKMALGYSSTRTRTDLTIEFDSDRTTGKVTMSLTATQTAALEAPARYVYDLDITDSSGTVTRIIEGLISVRPNV
jgi:hypothetical protein